MSGWDGWTRRTELPADWPRRRAAVKRRAGGQCEQLDPNTGQRCPEPGTECHHAGDRHDHNLHSLQWLCTECHAVITHEQASQARQAMHAKRHHPKRQSPGLIN